MHTSQDPQAPDANTTSPLDKEAIKQQLEQLAALDARQRERHLRQLAEQSPALAAALRPLAEQLDAPTLLPPVAQAMQALLDAAPNGEQRLGPWQLDRELGRGGMGVVYLAHRADGHYERSVAIKLIHGTQSDALLSEVRLLARLNHPHIAQLIDAGLSPQGQAYLVMEWVPEGQPLTRYAEENHSSTRQRIQLMLQLCDAVAYAHRHLVIHRDLKPGNVLVNAEGQVKLLDFGVARLLDQDPEHTRQLAGYTPSYASPEQLRQHTLSTASDVFSLGVMLFELLLGCHPYRRPDETAPDYTTRLLSQSPAIDWPAGARLDADLRAVLAQALALDQERRTASAEALAADLRAWLDELPVQARGPSLAYRSRKFIARHRWIVGTAALGLVGTLGFALHATQSAREAQAQRELAEARLEDVRSFANKVIRDYNGLLAPIEGTLKVRERIIGDALAYLDRQSAHADLQPELQAEIADGYSRIAQVLGGTQHQGSQGRYEAALRSAERALTLQRPLCDRGLRHPDGELACIRELRFSGQAAGAALQLADGAPAGPLLDAARQRAERLSTQVLTPRDRALLRLRQTAIEHELAVLDGIRQNDGSALLHMERALAHFASLDAGQLSENEQQAMLLDQLQLASMYAYGLGALGRPHQAVQRLAPLLPRWQSAVSQRSGQMVHALLAEVEQKVGSAYATLGGRAHALALLERQDQRMRALVDREREGSMFRYGYAVIGWQAVRSLRTLGAVDEACEMVTRMWSYAAPLLGNAEQAAEALQVERELARCHLAQGRAQAAWAIQRSWAQRRLAHDQGGPLAAQQPSSRVYTDISLFMMEQVLSLRALGRPADAAVLWRDTLPRLEAGLRANPEALGKQLMLMRHWHLASDAPGQGISGVDPTQARKRRDELLQALRAKLQSGDDRASEPAPGLISMNF